MKTIIYRLWDEVWNLGKLDVVEEIIDIGCVNHISGFSDLQGWAGLKSFVSQFRNAFPDIKINVEEQIEEGNRVATRWIAKGTHQGELMDVKPTGKNVTVEGITIYKFENNKGVEAWTSWDAAGLMRQLTSEKYENQTKEIYRAIGQFAVKFEEMCYAMRNTILYIFQNDGLKTQSLAQGMMAYHPAKLLADVFVAMVVEVRKDNQDDMEIIRKVKSQLEKFIVKRNDVIHSMWFVGWASLEQDDFSTATSATHKRTIRGVEFKHTIGDVPYFDNLSAEADKLINIIKNIDGCLMSKKQFSHKLNISTIICPDGNNKKIVIVQP